MVEMLICFLLLSILMVSAKKDDIDKAIFRDSKQYQDAYDKFSDYRDNARQAKNVMNFGLILGGIIFTTGVVLSF